MLSQPQRRSIWGRAASLPPQGHRSYSEGLGLTM